MRSIEKRNGRVVEKDLDEIVVDRKFVDRYRVLSPSEYLILLFLFSLPVVGWILIIYYSFGGTKNVNLKNFASSYIYALGIIGIFYLIMLACGGVAWIASLLGSWLS